MSGSRSRGSLHFVVLLLALASPAAAEVVKVEEGISIDLPTGWLVLPREFRNVVEVAPDRPDKNGLYPLRVQIWVEKRRSADESIRRLGEIAAEWKGERHVILVEGWPAVLRRYDFPLPRRGPNAGAPRRISPSLTIAVAYGARVIRMEAHLLPEGDRSLLEVVAKFPSLLRLAEKGKQTDAGALRKRIENAAPAKPKAPKRTGAARSSARGAAAPGTASLVRPDNLGELEVAVSPDGTNVVIATNAGFAGSNDSGRTFPNSGPTPQPACCSQGDPSVTWGASGTFYYAFIGLPDGTGAWDGDSGCSTAIATSTNNGRSFAWVSNATLCTGTACFPDQEHIAADRRNRGPEGRDQLYSVWRHFRPTAAAACNSFNDGTVTASIVCSQDSAATWTSRVSVDPAGDFPRVTVGRDGFVYVTYQAGDNVMLHKFSSCASGLVEQPGFPVTVSAFDAVQCPVPGLDRCDDGNSLASQTVAADGGDPNHLFLAFAQNTGAANEDVFLFDSVDGGATWPRQRTVNDPVTGRRFMPWLCSTDGRAFVGWYDRRAAGAAQPDLTEYFVGEVLVRSGALDRGFERNLSGIPDPQCAPGFPCGARNANDAQGCPGGPFRLGVCVSGGVPTEAICDLAAPFGACGGVGFEVCVPGPGCPKYGDYNGIACSDNAVHVAWASATAPAGVDTPAEGIDIFAERIVVRESGVDRLCRAIRGGCRGVFEMNEGLLRLLCPDRNCLVIDPLPQNCLVKWGCPGCKPGMLCPPFSDIVLEGITNEDWKVALVDFDGRPVQHRVRSADGRTIVSFRPDKATFREGSIGDYALLFTPGPKHVAGRIYDVKTRLEQGNEAFGGSKK